MSDVHEGGCVCGAVRYRVRGEPLRAYVCHCTYCQRTFSTAFGLLTGFNHENIEIDETLLSTYDHTVDDIDRSMRNQFCNRCGTTIMLSTHHEPHIRYIAVGTYDDPNWVDLKGQLWMRSAQRWVLMPECLERYERGTQHGPPMP